MNRVVADDSEMSYPTAVQSRKILDRIEFE